MSLITDKSIARREVLRLSAEAAERIEDAIAVEEPLEIRVNGEAVAVTMRTPGDDHRLAIGFLYAEGIIRGSDDLGTVTHCGRPGEEGYGNVIDCLPAPGVNLSLERLESSRRGTLTTSACGVCGRRTVEDLVEAAGEVAEGLRVGRSVLARSTEALRDVQRVFEQTGGTHAAAVLDPEGQLLAGFEDVGRHNAVDKVVGELVLRGLSAARAGVGVGVPEMGTPAVLVVSGRASFEIVQKAARAGIPIVASVSAASSLAIDLAERVNVALATFVRGGTFNLCTHAERVDLCG